MCLILKDLLIKHCKNFETDVIKRNALVILLGSIFRATEKTKKKEKGDQDGRKSNLQS